MKHIEKQIKKVCSLYVNDWHLTTMILPHINQITNKNKQIITILETEIKENIEEILSKMNLKKESNEKILEISWTSNSTCKYEKIKNQISKNIKELEIIVKGTKEYIENAGKEIEKLINEINLREITIINCYEISKYKSINEIIEQYDYILNTSGIKKIQDMFDTSEERKEGTI